MPAVPVIAAVTGASAVVGAAAATAIGLGTVGAVAATAIGTGIIAGATTAVMGGDASDVLESAVIGGVTSAIGGTVAPAISSAVTEATGSVIAGNVAAGAVTGGINAEASGGDFAEGALLGGLTSGVTTALDEAKLAAQRSAFEDSMIESGLAGQTSVSQADLDAVNAPYTPTTDFSFTPDYSLSTGGSGVGLQVPTINDVVDVLAGPVDYSLTAPPSETGLYIPTVLGDEQSFINQPAYNVDAGISDIPSTLADTSSTVAALDAAKSLAPSVISAALADKITPPEEITGFAIVPVPADWKSPEYNMEFTPSAPIDFGTRELLRGTQWENPQITPPRQYTLTDLINTLNMDSVPFVQQNYEFNPASFELPDILQQFNVAPTVGMTDIIGNLNNQPVSISDIIAGIQSGQNYSI